MDSNVKKKAQKVKVLAFDVDGVMTNGDVTYDENGVEYKTFNVKDGHGLVRAQKSGFVTAIITARNNGTVKHRAENLNITELYQGQKFKLPALEEIIAKYNYTMEQVAYMGDDLPDLCILEKVGFSACPHDAVDEVLAECDYVAEKSGGRGAVREMIDFILEAQGIEKIRTVSEGACK